LRQDIRLAADRYRGIGYCNVRSLCRDEPLKIVLHLRAKDRASLWINHDLPVIAGRNPDHGIHVAIGKAAPDETDGWDARNHEAEDCAPSGGTPLPAAP